MTDKLSPDKLAAIAAQCDAAKKDYRSEFALPKDWRIVESTHDEKHPVMDSLEDITKLLAHIEAMARVLYEALPAVHDSAKEFLDIGDHDSAEKVLELHARIVEITSQPDPSAGAGEECSECGGEGTVIIDYIAHTAASSDEVTSEEEDCPTCSGSGRMK